MVISANELSSVSAVGFFGGTFNPVHIGHLRAALDCLNALNLDQIALLPAASPPLKEAPLVAAEQRAEMLQLAVSGTAGLTIDCRELSRPGLSYTVDTLAELRSEYPKDTSITFVIGMDSLITLHQWHEWPRLFDLANIAIMARPGVSPRLDSDVKRAVESRICLPDEIRSRPAGGVTFVDQPPLDVSSTAVRSALMRGKNVQFLLPEAVIEYIVTNKLYDSSNTDHRGGH